MNCSNPLLIENKENLLNQTDTLLVPSNNDQSLCFNFHGVRIKFFSSNNQLLKDLREYLPSEWLCVDQSSPITIIHSAFPNQELDWEDEESSDVLGSNHLTGIQRDFAALRTEDNQHCYVFFNKTIDDGLHNFMRWFLSPLLLEKKKAILHSSALVNKSQKAFLFLGPSGAGKTTVTSLGCEHLVLSDDMNLIDFSENLEVFAGGVGGLYKPQVSIAQGFPIKTAYWIIQSNEHIVKEVSRKKQMRYLLASFANLSWNSVDKIKSDSILKSAESILQHLVIKELYFKKDAGFWEVI